MNEFEFEDFQESSELLGERIRDLPDCTSKVISSSSCPTLSTMEHFCGNLFPNQQELSSTQPVVRKSNMKPSSSMSNLAELERSSSVRGKRKWKRFDPNDQESTFYGHFVNEDLIISDTASLDCALDSIAEDAVPSVDSLLKDDDPISQRKKTLRKALEQPQNNDLFSSENAEKTAGSLWLLLHSWKCKTERCNIPSCDVMKKVAMHCVDCEKDEGDCVESCNQAKAMLLHYADCGKKNPIESTNCPVCRRLVEIEKETKTRAAPPVIVPTIHPAVVYRAKVDATVRALIATQIYKHATDGTPLLPISALQRQAKWMVDHEILMLSSSSGN